MKRKGDRELILAKAGLQREAIWQEKEGGFVFVLALLG